MRPGAFFLFPVRQRAVPDRFVFPAVDTPAFNPLCDPSWHEHNAVAVVVVVIVVARGFQVRAAIQVGSSLPNNASIQSLGVDEGKRPAFRNLFFDTRQEIKSDVREDFPRKTTIKEERRRNSSQRPNFLLNL